MLDEEDEGDEDLEHERDLLQVVLQTDLHEGIIKMNLMNVRIRN